MNKIKKRLTAVMAGGAIATAGLFAPQAMAAESTEMELRILQMEESLRMMRNELETVRAGSQTGRFDALEERMGAVETADMPFGRVFFRSGLQNNNVGRGGEILIDAGYNDTAGTVTGNPPNGSQQAWYFGAGIEHGLSRDLFGLMDDTHFMGEITINYADHGKKTMQKMPLATVANDSYDGATGGNGTGLCAGSANPYSNNNSEGACVGTVTVTQLKITASPKIRFAGLSNSLMGFEPWVIPGGFTLNVISPPSEGVTYIAPGVQWGAGVDYPLFKSLTVGVEGNYNMVRDTELDGTRISGYEVGGTLGFKF